MSSLRTRAVWAACALAVLLFPLLASSFLTDLASQVLLAAIGAIALMLLTGHAGQISLGHAGLLASGAFVAGILTREAGAGIWFTLPCAALAGALLGVIFGLPSLRLRGLYLAVSTLALHFIVIYAGSEYESRRGLSTGILLEPPRIGGWTLSSPAHWYWVLLLAATACFACSEWLVRGRTGRAWAAIRTNETVAAAMGIPVAANKLLAFVISSAMAATAGALFAHWRGFVSVEAFSLFLSIQYVAMIIVGGVGSLAGAVLGAFVVTLLPYAIEWALALLPNSGAMKSMVFAVNQAFFGLVMVLFILYQPAGMVGLWRRLRDSVWRTRGRMLS